MMISDDSDVLLVLSKNDDQLFSLVRAFSSDTQRQKFANLCQYN